ncbi:MAG: peroxiredoxin family protein [Polyangiaceae bacterium]
MKAMRNALAIGALAFFSSACGAGALSQNQGLPDFELLATSGEVVRMSDHLGKDVILLTFWDARCDGCLRQMPAFADLYTAYKDRGFIVLAVSVDSPRTSGSVASIAADREMTFPVLRDLDGAIFAQYSARRMLPYTLLIDRRGNVAIRLEGKWIASREVIEEPIVHLLQEPVPQPSPPQ